MPRRRRATHATALRALLPALALALVPSACGSQDDPRAFPPAAGPARAPAPAAEPAGRVVRVGNAPEGVVVDAVTGLAAVALTGPDELALVDLDSLEVVRRVALPGAPRHLRLARPGGPVLVPAASGDRLVEVSLPGGRARETRVGDGPHEADAADGRVFVGDELGSTLSVVQDGRRVRRVGTGRQPGGLATIPGGPVALVALRERTLELYDRRSASRLARAPAGVGPTHVEAGAGGRVYVADTDGDALLFFTTRPDVTLERRYALPGAPYGMTVDRTKGKLWVTLTARNEVVQLTADAHPRAQRRFPTVRQPNSVAVHEPTGRVFVASRTDGTLQVFDGYPVRRPGERRSRARGSVPGP